MDVEVRLFDDLIETFDLGDPEELRRLVLYLNYHSRNRRYELKNVSSPKMISAIAARTTAKAATPTQPLYSSS